MTFYSTLKQSFIFKEARMTFGIGTYMADYEMYSRSITDKKPMGDAEKNARSAIRTFLNNHPDNDLRVNYLKLERKEITLITKYHEDLAKELAVILEGIGIRVTITLLKKEPLKNFDPTEYLNSI